VTNFVKTLIGKLSGNANIRPNIVETAKAHLRRAISESQRKPLPDPGGRWENYCNQARLVVDRFNDPIEVIHYVQSPEANTGFETRPTGQALIDDIRSIEQLCATTFPEFSDYITTFIETSLSFPDTTAKLKDRLVSTPLLWHMFIIMRCIRYCRPRTILEIGGGYGAPSRVWMTNGLHRPDSYIDVDFPESLFYAEVYLRATLPDREIVYLHDGDDLGTEPAGQIVLCPIANVNSVLGWPIDLVINTGSMQEMSDEYVAFYMDRIQRSNCDRFYSFNYFAQPINDRQESMNMAAPTMSKEWSTVFKAFHAAGLFGSAELLFSRSGESADCILAAEAAVSGTYPADGSAFLDLFDIVRRVDRGDLLITAAANAMLGMPYVPKEALWLARRATPAGSVEKVVLRLLEHMAAEGDPHKIQNSAAKGRVEANDLILDRTPYQLIQHAGGSLESFIEMHGAMEIAGWAGDCRTNRPALSIIASVDGTVVSRTVPIGMRQDIEAGYGSGIRPAQFTIKVPLPNAPRDKLPLIRLFAITTDYKAMPLVSSLPPGTLPALGRRMPPCRHRMSS
jgi:putative sugar O-methyltransferase